MVINVFNTDKTFETERPVRREIVFGESESVDVESRIGDFLLPVFQIDNEYYVLVKDLAQLWCYPSSYQLIKKLVKGGLDKEQILKTDVELNNELFEKGVIDTVDTTLFYANLKTIFSIVKNSEIFFTYADFNTEEATDVAGSDEKITLTQIFPQYGKVQSSLDMTPSAFNCLNIISKLNFYRTLPNAYQFQGNPKLNFAERELIYREFEDSSSIGESQEEPEKRSIGRPRKTHNVFDVNSLDLQDTLVPGQGYIQEFNVNHICKVPNYYAQVGSKSGSGHKKGNAVSSLLFNEGSKLSKNVQQLVSNNDIDNHSHVKYFYIRSYRGPGTGNFKDATIINKINNIPLSPTPLKKLHINPKDIARHSRKRHANSLKGLLHDRFYKPFVTSVISLHSNENDDGANLEMLHNNLQFNILMNSYREMSEETWRQYYKFKLTDREQLSMRKRNPQAPILHSFTMPTAHKEIVRNLPIEVRPNDEPDVKQPIYYSATYPNVDYPQLLNKVELIKFPNSNEIGWDNLRKYRDI